MAKSKTMKKEGAIKLAVRALQKSMSLSRKGRRSDQDVEEVHGTEEVPEDVKEGQFAVMAVLDEKPKRFVVSLDCLSHPVFLRLLELAEEEFGFRHEGALALPCRSSDLERIIGDL